MFNLRHKTRELYIAVETNDYRKRRFGRWFCSENVSWACSLAFSKFFSSKNDLFEPIFCSDVKNQSQYLQILPEEEHVFELYSSASLTDMNELFLSEKMFTTLATISQSRIAVQQLIGCGFLGSLANIVSGKCFTLSFWKLKRITILVSISATFTNYNSTKKAQFASCSPFSAPWKTHSRLIAFPFLSNIQNPFHETESFISELIISLLQLGWSFFNIFILNIFLFVTLLILIGSTLTFLRLCYL